MSLSSVSLPIIAVMCVLAGCTYNTPTQNEGGVIVAKDPTRNTEAARFHNDEAAKLLDCGDLVKAEAELRAAIAADQFFGPAHNNLGTVFFRRKCFYQAAVEYQTAAQFMPTRSEPRANLGLVFEVTTRFEDAIKSYEEALSLDPNNMLAVGNLARVYTRQEIKPERTRELLKQIVLKDTRPGWVSWAKERLAIMGTTQPAR